MKGMKWAIYAVVVTSLHLNQVTRQVPAAQATTTVTVTIEPVDALTLSDGRHVWMTAIDEVCSVANETMLQTLLLTNPTTLAECADLASKALGGWAGTEVFFKFATLTGQCDWLHAQPQVCPLGNCPTLASKTCPQGFMAQPGTNVYAIRGHSEPHGECEVVRMVRASATCSAPSAVVGQAPNLTACVDSVQLAAGEFFTYTPPIFPAVTSECKVVRAATADCHEGWANDTSSFYAIDHFANRSAVWISTGNLTETPGRFAEKIKDGYTCSTADKILGSFASLKECGEAVAVIGGLVFDYGRADAGKLGVCKVEDITVDTPCESYVMDKAFDTYQLGSIPGHDQFGKMPPCMQPLSLPADVRNDVIIKAAAHESKMQRTNPAIIQPGVEALKLARETRARVVAFRDGLLRGARAHAAAVQPQAKQDMHGNAAEDTRKKVRDVDMS